jgi:glycosyltransferase involved in cell wall biosynthesis
MSKPLYVISCPFDTYSGYGARSRDYVKAVLELDQFDVRLIPQRWGETAWGFCEDFPEWKHLYDLVIPGGKLETQPDVWTQITIPNEFQPVGKYNIGVTAGVESTVCAQDWVEGLNRVDVTFVSSEHSKKVFETVQYEKKDKRTDQVVDIIKLQKPVEVLFEGMNLDIYKKITPKEIVDIDLSPIKEEFCYLFVGHWMAGNLGHDRKNVGLLVKSFLETFKNKPGKKPALILKASVGSNSYSSREEILKRINKIKATIPSKNLPNIYVLSGEFSDEEMNQLYNHPKVKAMVSITKGEGYGRPLLEFTATGKPIMASGWSGQVDFLKPDMSFLLPGKLENIHKSAANKWLLESGQWFTPDLATLGNVFKDMVKHYKKYLAGGKKQKYYAKNNFSFEAMKDLLGKHFDKYIPKFPTKVELNIPTLEKID